MLRRSLHVDDAPPGCHGGVPPPRLRVRAGVCGWLFILVSPPSSAVPAAGEGQGLHPAARPGGAGHAAPARPGCLHPGVGGVPRHPGRSVPTQT